MRACGRLGGASGATLATPRWARWFDRAKRASPSRSADLRSGKLLGVGFPREPTRVETLLGEVEVAERPEPLLAGDIPDLTAPPTGT